MVTIARFGKNTDWIGHLVSAAARSAYAGAIHQYDRIVAASIRLERRIYQAARDATPRTAENVFRWSPVRQRELEHAVDQWDNEGGALGRASPAGRSPKVSLVGTPQYLNEIGVREIRIGATEFHCIGALPPQDHPHIYLNMEGKPHILCPYCSTIYIYDRRLRPDETEPAGCFYAPVASEIAIPADGGVS